MKKLFSTLITASLLTLATPSFAQETVTSEDVEKLIYESCAASAGNKAEDCKCAVSGLKKETPKEDYDRFMTLMVFLLSGDTQGRADFPKTSDLTAEGLTEWNNTLVAAGKRVEEQCGVSELNLDMNY